MTQTAPGIKGKRGNELLVHMAALLLVEERTVLENTRRTAHEAQRTIAKTWRLRPVPGGLSTHVLFAEAPFEVARMAEVKQRCVRLTHPRSALAHAAAPGSMLPSRNSMRRTSSYGHSTQTSRGSCSMCVGVLMDLCRAA